MTPGTFRSNMRSLSVILLILTGCFAIIAGFSFVKDPSGKELGMHVGELSFSPFQDYLIPGILLLLFNGVLNIACATFAAARWRQAAQFLIFQGWVLIIWILAQVAMLQAFNLLHAACLIIGVIWLYTGNLLQKSFKI